MADDPSEAAEIRWARRPDALWRRTFDRVVILDPATREPLDLKFGGAAIWDRLESPATASEIARDLTKVYDGDFPVVYFDVSSLLERLYELGIVMHW